MGWKQLRDGFSMAVVEAGDSVDEALIELCKQIRLVVIPRHEDTGWDYLRIELWADSGRMIVFPASMSTRDRIEKAGCQMVFSELLDRYDNLVDSGLDDDAFADALREEEQAWINRFLTAAQCVGLEGNRVLFWNGDGKRLICDQSI